LKKVFFTSLFLLIPLLFSAQEEKTNKGKIYFFWGWNESWYSNSDIHFTGNNYDFTLQKVRAHDKQSDFSIDTYFAPKNITLPQTNLRVGYFISDKYDISFGVDHMKYVMSSNQSVRINGNINDGSVYDGRYFNDVFLITPSFLKFEHTDGLNYLNIEITRNDNINELFRWLKSKDKIQLSTLIGFGGGPVMPKSNVTLWNKERHDKFHFAGYGFSGKIGLNITFYNYFFLRSEFKGGFIDLSDIRTSSDASDKASQHFFFTEFEAAFGVIFPLF